MRMTFIRSENMSVYVKKADVMQILYECITVPEVDESDHALVDYRKAKEKMLDLDEILIESNEDK